MCDRKVSPFSVKLRNAESSPRQVTKSSRLYSYGKILVFNSKWLPDLPRVDFQGGSFSLFMVLGKKTQVFNTVNHKNNC